MATLSTRKIVQASAAGKGRSHPARSESTTAGADSVRRRLSNIFQKPMAVR